MLLKTEGIIIRGLKYSETSLILDVYTEAIGKRSFIVGGVRKAKSRTNSGILQIMNIIELLAYHREGNQLMRIKEFKPAYLYKNLPFDPVKRALGVFLTEVLQRSIREPEQNPPLYDFIKKSFILADTSKHSLANFALSFMIKLSAYLGFYPNDTWTPESPAFNLREGAFVPVRDLDKHILDPIFSPSLRMLLINDLEECHSFSIKKKLRKALLDEILRFYQIHVDGFGHLKSLPIFSQIFNP